MLYSACLDHGQNQVHGRDRVRRTRGQTRETRTEWISRALGAMYQEWRKGPSDLTRLWRRGTSPGVGQTTARLCAAPTPGQQREEDPNALRLVHQLQTPSPQEKDRAPGPTGVIPSPHSRTQPTAASTRQAPRPLPCCISPVSLLRTALWQDIISFSWRSRGAASRLRASNVSDIKLTRSHH